MLGLKYNGHRIPPGQAVVAPLLDQRALLAEESPNVGSKPRIRRDFLRVGRKNLVGVAAQGYLLASSLLIALRS
jgi:hypothetical protein